MMARKPPPSLPDVFAKPGAAPPRGTPIEELPQEPPPQAVVPEAELLTEEPPSPPPPPPEEPKPKAVQPNDELYVPPVRPAPVRGRGGVVLAAIALVVGLTTPFWEDSVLSLLGVRTPEGRAAEQSRLAVMRLDQRTADIAQRLSVAAAQMTRQQAEFAAAMQRADQAGNMIRTMALVRLSDTLRRPIPFGAELAVVEANGTDLGELKPLLAQIEPYAATGIPGVTQLRQEFQALLDQVQPTGRGGSASWISSLTSWARPRAAAPAPGADPSLDLLQSAAARLADVDVAGAVEQMRQVSDTYRPAFASWVEDAQARVAADMIAEKVADMVTKALRQTGAK